MFKASLYKFTKACLVSSIALLPSVYSASSASEILIVNQSIESIEEIKKSKIRNNGKLVVKFCTKLKDYEGFVSVAGKKFFASEADIKKPKKLVWFDSGFKKDSSKLIDTDSLKANYFDEDSSENTKTVLKGDCPGGFPLAALAIVAGVAAASGGGGSGGSSSN